MPLIVWGVLLLLCVHLLVHVFVLVCSLVVVVVVHQELERWVVGRWRRVVPLTVWGRSFAFACTCACTCACACVLPGCGGCALRIGTLGCGSVPVEGCAAYSVGAVAYEFQCPHLPTTKPDTNNKCRYLY